MKSQTEHKLLKGNNASIIFILIFIVCTTFLHSLSFDKLPTKIHAWAQSDHYALALGFVNNGFDFFHPQTFALSHQFPPKEALTNPEGITAVDFPILHYSAAVLMKSLNSTHPAIFRLLSLLVSFISLFYLFKTLNKTKGFWVALFATSFIMFQPIYCYYQNGFHVSSGAFNIQLIGITFLLKHWYNGNRKFLYWGIVFLTTAALMRFTQIITLLALASALALSTLKNRKFDNRIIAVGFGLIVVISSFIYNKYMGLKYGSIFLSTPLIADSLTDFAIHVLHISKSYLRGFLPFTHLFALIITVYVFIKDKRKQEHLWLHWLFFSILGTSMFSILMSWSLSAHDYYSLDTWLAPLTIGLIFCLYQIDFKKYNPTTVALLISMFTIGIFSVALEHQVRKYSDKMAVNGCDLTIQNFSESAEFLDSSMPQGSKILLITGNGWNTPMVGWQRQVYRIAWKFEEQIPKELQKDYEFIVTQDVNFKDEVLANFPEFNTTVDLYKSNGIISIWRKK